LRKLDAREKLVFTICWENFLELTVFIFIQHNIAA